MTPDGLPDGRPGTVAKTQLENGAEVECPASWLEVVLIHAPIAGQGQFSRQLGAAHTGGRLFVGLHAWSVNDDSCVPAHNEIPTYTHDLLGNRR